MSFQDLGGFDFRAKPIGKRRGVKIGITQHRTGPLGHRRTGDAFGIPPIASALRSGTGSQIGQDFRCGGVQACDHGPVCGAGKFRLDHRNSTRHSNQGGNFAFQPDRSTRRAQSPLRFIHVEAKGQPITRLGTDHAHIAFTINHAQT